MTVVCFSCLYFPFPTVNSWHSLPPSMLLCLSLTSCLVSDTCSLSLSPVCPCRLPHGAVYPVVHHYAGQAAHPEQPVWSRHTVSDCATCSNIHFPMTLTHRTQAEQLSIGHCMWVQRATEQIMHTHSAVLSPERNHLNACLVFRHTYLGSRQHLAELCQPAIFSDLLHPSVQSNGSLL